jgi:protein gp37
MHPDWVRSLRDQCQASGMPFFFKQWGEFHPFDKSVIPDYGPDSPAEIIPTRYIRVGKKRAGRVLDGVTWDEYPR